MTAGTLPTGYKQMRWNKHPEIKFFYATTSERYIYFLYRQNVRCWVWEIWERPVNKDLPRTLKHSSFKICEGARLQFRTALAQANAWLWLYEGQNG